MKQLAQDGAQAGDRILDGLKAGVIDGVIFSPRDRLCKNIGKRIEELALAHPTSIRLFDPQYYATTVAAQAGARLGKLDADEPYPYFERRGRRDFEKDSVITKDLDACIEFQSKLGVTGVIAPNIVIRKSLDSIEGAVAKRFIRQSADAARRIAPKMKCYATLAISVTALADKVELMDFLQSVTELDSPVHGFYVLIDRPASDAIPELSEQMLLSRWMLINHTLKINGFEVINGYADVLSPYLSAVGADMCAGGWYNTQKIFSMKRFEADDDDTFKSRPMPRYTSVALMKSIRYTDLQATRRRFGRVLNGLPCDLHYPYESGSLPADDAGEGMKKGSKEALQNWEAIRRLSSLAVPGDVAASLKVFLKALDNAELLYRDISKAGISLLERSNASHLDVLRDELDEFGKLAELS